MGLICKLVDAILFMYFLMVAVAAILIDSQIVLPSCLFPDFLIELSSSFTRDSGDYLVAEKPYFFVGLVWSEILVQLPLSIANLYGILSNKSWFKTTCLIYGVSSCTGMVAILSEMWGSQKASNKLFMIYCPFLGIAFLAVLRGLVPCSSKSTSTNATRSAMATKKRA